MFEIIPWSMENEEDPPEGTIADFIYNGARYLVFANKNNGESD